MSTGAIIFWTIVVTVVISVLLAFFGPEYRGSNVGAETNGGEPTTLLVVPFENGTGNPELRFFADGLTEEVIASLRSVSGPRFRVIARTTATAVTRGGIRLNEIAGELGITHLLEGGVTGPDRVTARLTRIEDSQLLWADSLERGRSGLSSLPRSIAAGIADALALGNVPAAHSSQPDQDAWLAFLRGRALLNRLTLEDTRRALPFLQAATMGDPNYAEALAALAEANFRIGEARLARDAASAALEIDSTSVEANRVMGNVLTYEDWDFEAALAAFQRGMRHHPSPGLRHSYSFLLAYLGWTDRAIEQLELALVEDPISPPLLNDLGLVLNMVGEHRRAVECCRRTLELEAGNVAARDCLTNAYLGLDRPDSAMIFVRQAWIARGNDADLLAPTSVAPSIRVRTWRERQLELIEQQTSGSTAGVRRARLYLMLGDTTTALQLLQGAVFTRQPAVLWLGTDPAFEGLRGKNEMDALLARIGLR